MFILVTYTLYPLISLFLMSYIILVVSALYIMSKMNTRRMKNQHVILKNLCFIGLLVCTLQIIRLIYIFTSYIGNSNSSVAQTVYLRTNCFLVILLLGYLEFTVILTYDRLFLVSKATTYHLVFSKERCVGILKAAYIQMGVVFVILLLIYTSSSFKIAVAFLVAALICSYLYLLVTYKRIYVASKMRIADQFQNTRISNIETRKTLYISIVLLTSYLVFYVTPGVFYLTISGALLPYYENALFFPFLLMGFQIDYFVYVYNQRDIYQILKQKKKWLLNTRYLRVFRRNNPSGPRNERVSAISFVDSKLLPYNVFTNRISTTEQTAGAIERKFLEPRNVCENEEIIDEEIKSCIVVATA